MAPSEAALEEAGAVAHASVERRRPRIGAAARDHLDPDLRRERAAVGVRERDAASGHTAAVGQVVDRELERAARVLAPEEEGGPRGGRPVQDQLATVAGARAARRQSHDGDASRHEAGDDGIAADPEGHAVAGREAGVRRGRPAAADDEDESDERGDEKRAVHGFRPFLPWRKP